MNARPLVAIVASALLGGCTTGAWKDRGHDLAQIFDASLSFGEGIAVSARVTELAQVGVGYFGGASAGLMDGRLAVAHEQRDEFGVSLLHTYGYWRDHSSLLDVRHPYYADPGYEEHPLSWRMNSDRDDSDIGFNLHIVYVGVGASVKLGELWDFVAGCFGFDPLHDDAYGRTVAELRQQALSLDSAKRDRAFDALLRRGEGTHGYAIYTAPGVRPSYQRRAMDAIQADLARVEE